MTERAAWLHLGGWHGHSRQPVLVVGETPKRFRIRPAGTKPVQLGGRNRHVHAGETALVPRYAITFAEAPHA